MQNFVIKICLSCASETETPSELTGNHMAPPKKQVARPPVPHGLRSAYPAAVIWRYGQAACLGHGMPPGCGLWLVAWGFFFAAGRGIHLIKDALVGKAHLPRQKKNLVDPLCNSWHTFCLTSIHYNNNFNWNCFSASPLNLPFVGLLWNWADPITRISNKPPQNNNNLPFNWPPNNAPQDRPWMLNW